MSLNWLPREGGLKDHNIWGTEHFGTEAPCTIYEERPILDPSGKPIKDLYSAWIILNQINPELLTADLKNLTTQKVTVDLMEEVETEAREFYKLMLTRNFLPNSPTLMNAGKNNGLQYSACYVIPVPDSLEGIFDGVKWQGLIHQSGGGTGFSFSRLRPKGSRVKTSMGVASGPVPFMRIYNEATQQIKQGGTRRGANMGILRVDHPDVLEFIHCKDDGVGITNFNISVTITDKFMQALEEDGEYDLIAPHNGEVTGIKSPGSVG